MVDHRDLDAHIARIRQLSNLAAKSAPQVAKELDAELRSQIAAGKGPDGKAWKPTKAGTPPLRNAHETLRVRALGTVILASLEGRHALHDRGWVRGGIRRQILPSAGVPQPVAKAVEKAVTAEFRRTMGGTAR